jgi:hypothetical protein
MAHVIEPGETDLIIPLPEPGEEVHPYTVHTHYFGFTIPEAGIGAYVYARYMPAFGISQGGPTIFRGMDNVSLLDAEYHDYRATMPWPEIDGHRIRFRSGYQIDFLEPGVLARLSYESPDGAVSFELEQRAVTPLLRRGHIVPGEEAHQGDPRRRHGGTEQFMHCTGVLCLHDEKLDVDCYAVRDRSWNQVRTEDPGGAQKSPPIGWSPAYFGDDLAFNVTSFEAPDTSPAWSGLYDVPDGAPTSYYKWMVADGQALEIASVRRNVLAYHPVLGSAIVQELELVDETGAVHRFEGRALSVTPMHSWPNIAFTDSVHRWEDERGRVTYCTYQEIWWDSYQRRVKAGRDETALATAVGNTRRVGPDGV